MLGSLILFLVAAVAGFRRGVLDGKAIVAIASISLLFLAVIVVGRGSFTPLALQPGALGIGLLFLGYFLPLLAGFAVGSIAKRQRLKNDAGDDGPA